VEPPVQSYAGDSARGRSRKLSVAIPGAQRSSSAHAMAVEEDDEDQSPSDDLLEEDLYSLLQPILEQPENGRDLPHVMRAVQRVLRKSTVSPDTWSGPGTPLNSAVRANRSDVVRLLLRAKATVNDQDDKGVSPLHLAVFEGSLEIMQMLLAGRAHIDACDRHGQTPLFFVPSRDVCKFLLDRRADCNLQNRKGQTALHLAGRAGLKEVFSCISAHAPRALADHRDAHWATAKDYMQQTSATQADGPPPTPSSATKAQSKTIAAPKIVDRRSNMMTKNPSANNVGTSSGQQLRDSGHSSGAAGGGGGTVASRRSAMPRMTGRASAAATLQSESASRRQTTNLAKHRASSPPPLEDDSLTSSSKPSTPMVTPAQRMGLKMGRLQQDPEGRRELQSHAASAPRTPHTAAVTPQITSGGVESPHMACDSLRPGEATHTRTEEAEEQAPAVEAELEALSEFERSPGVPLPGDEDGEEPALPAVCEAEDAADILVPGDNAHAHPAEQESLPGTHHFAESEADRVDEQNAEEEEEDDEVW